MEQSSGKGKGIHGKLKLKSAKEERMRCKAILKWRSKQRLVAEALT